jgi:hypothetical protein
MLETTKDELFRQSGCPLGETKIDGGQALKRRFAKKPRDLEAPEILLIRFISDSCAQSRLRRPRLPATTWWRAAYALLR